MSRGLQGCRAAPGCTVGSLHGTVLPRLAGNSGDVFGWAASRSEVNCLPRVRVQLWGMGRSRVN